MYSLARISAQKDARNLGYILECSLVSKSGLVGYVKDAGLYSLHRVDRQMEDILTGELSITLIA